MRVNIGRASVVRLIKALNGLEQTEALKDVIHELDLFARNMKAKRVKKKLSLGSQAILERAGIEPTGVYSVDSETVKQLIRGK